MYRYIIFVMALTASFYCMAKPRSKRVCVEYIYHIPNNVSQDEAKTMAIERAQAQAIADEFGTIVTQSTSIQIETNDQDTSTDFLSIGGSELKGEWIETTVDPTFEFITDGDQLALKVIIEGVIREIEGARVPYEVKILRNGISDNYESDVFKKGDELFMSFTSPSSGYLAIYLIDAEKQAYCLLPYQNQDSGIFSIKANRRYVLFHPDSSEDVDKTLVDEIITDTSLTKERNRVVCIFSPNKFYKAADTKTHIDIPRNLSYKNFQKWLATIKRKDVEVSIVELSILIVSE